MVAIRLAAGFLALLLAGPALAQDAPRVAIRGTIETVANDGQSVQVLTREGEHVTMRLKQPPRINTVVAATLADIKPGLFVGAGAMPGAGGVQIAMEVHIFPEAMRGSGEGFRAFDLAPGSTMTNGSIQARVDGVNGPKLTVTYKGGEKTIAIDDKTRIVSFEAGSPVDLKPGAAVVARGVKAADGAYDVAFVVVGKNGVKPPM
jgi:hypothetical protein